MNTIVDDQIFNELMNHNLNSEDQTLQKKTIKVLGHVYDFRDVKLKKPSLMVIQESTQEENTELLSLSGIDDGLAIKIQQKMNKSRNLSDIYN